VSLRGRERPPRARGLDEAYRVLYGSRKGNLVIQEASTGRVEGVKTALFPDPIKGMARRLTDPGLWEWG